MIKYLIYLVFDLIFYTFGVFEKKLFNVIEKKKKKHIDILKIDVEGSELDIINGMKSSLLKKKFTAIQIEITAKKSIFNLKENKIIKIMKKYNYYLEDKKNIFSVSILSNLKCTENLFLLK